MSDPNWNAYDNLAREAWDALRTELIAMGFEKPSDSLVWKMTQVVAQAEACKAMQMAWNWNNGALNTVHQQYTHALERLKAVQHKHQLKEKRNV